MMRSVMIWLLTILLTGLAVVARADVADPTRPLFFKSKKAAPVIKREPVVKPAEKPEIYRLTTTLVSQHRNIAVINDRVVTVGDSIGKAVVIEIQPTVVRLRSGSRQIELALAVEKIDKVWKRTGVGSHGSGQ